MHASRQVADILQRLCATHLSLHAGAVSARLSERDRPRGALEVRVRCLWLCGAPGGGMVRMLVQVGARALLCRPVSPTALPH